MTIRISAFALLFCFVSITASAGAKRDIPVEVDLVDMNASGMMWSAFNSDNDVEHIGCSYSYYSEFGVLATCFARDAEGVVGQCYVDETHNPEYVEAIKAITPYSHIGFAWDNDQWCTYLRVATHSYYLPEFKTKK